MSAVATEVRHAAQRLARTPTFAVAVIVTLAFSIGGNTAIFAVVNRVVLNPLPFPDSDRLLQLEHGSSRVKLASGIGMTSGLYYQYQRAHTLESLAVYRIGESALSGHGEPLRV